LLVLGGIIGEDPVRSSEDDSLNTDGKVVDYSPGWCEFSDETCEDPGCENAEEEAGADDGNGGCTTCFMCEVCSEGDEDLAWDTDRPDEE